MIAILASLVVTVLLLLLWSKLGNGVFWDRPEDTGLDPRRPSQRVPFAFFGYMLALILSIGAVRGFAVRLTQFSRTNLWPASSYLLPAGLLLAGVALGAFCLARGRRNRGRRS